MHNIRTLSMFQPVITGGVYFVAAMAALLVSRFEGGLAFIWVANAFLMADLITSPTRYWWKSIVACAIASTAATALFGMGPVAAVPMAAINIVEALIVAVIYRWKGSSSVIAGSLKPLLVFVVALCGIANVIAGLGAAAVASALTDNGFWSSWLQWYSGHVLGGLTCMPMLALLLQGELGRWFKDSSRRTKIEALILLGLFALLTWRVFYQATYPLLFLPMLPLVIISFRVGYLGASGAILLLAGIGGSATFGGVGPINMFDVPMGTRVQFFQLYLAVSFLISVPVAAELNGRKRLFALLRDSEARYRILADHSGDVVLNLDMRGFIRYASPSVLDHAGVQAQDLIGKHVTELVHVADHATVVLTHRRALDETADIHMVEFRPRRMNDESAWCEMVMRAILNDSGEPSGVVSTIRDMSRHKAVQRELKAAAYVDELTGAATRRALLERLDDEIAKARTGIHTCLALIDIDHFKAVNDQHGHGAGDQVLRAFVDQLRPGIRGSDMIGRLGGEEFAILLTKTDLAGASRMCERLRTMAEEMAVTLDDGQSVTVTFSAGLVELDGMMDATAVLDAADKALYEAKRSGRNCLRLAA
ncbi:diguanylate cyclase [Sphingobium sp. AN641]|uniref:sensor domain-containing diguanylate cyclase n=1 Tax=Sphingobium sp. AN641 TaxID=3133443 RepID=UPI0030C505D7